jgi:hypothetical protein
MDIVDTKGIEKIEVGELKVQEQEKKRKGARQAPVVGADK